MKTPIPNYWLSKLFYDLHTNWDLAAEYRKDRDTVLERYPLAAPVRDAVRRDDVAFLAPLTNPFLLRYYFIRAGMSEQHFVDSVRALGRTSTDGARNG